MPLPREDLARLRRAADPALDPPALDGLDAVNWATVKHAHGKATDVPVLLRAAASDDPDARDEAFELLGETIWHQGTVFTATSLVIPFLYRMLQSKETPDRRAVALLLATIAGNSYPDDNKHVIVCRWAIGEQLDLLYPFLRDPEWGVRQSVAHAISHYPEACVRLLKDLESAYRRESNLFVRMALARAIGHSSEAAARLLPDLQAAHRDEPDPYVQQALREVIDRLTPRST